MPHVVVISENTAFSSRLAGVLAADPEIRVDEAASIADARTLIAEQAPHAVALGPSLDADQAIDFAEEVIAATGSTAVVLVAADLSTDLMRRAMRCGIADVLSTADTFNDVAQAVKSTLGGNGQARPKPAAPRKPAPAKVAKGRVISVFSTKGGVGKSTIASNLAVALASMYGKRVILLDLDLQFGDAGIILDLKPERTIYDAVQTFDRLDPEMLSGFLTTHKSGARVLLAPIRPEEADVVTTSRAGTIIDMLRELADIVIVDTAATFDDIMLTAIDHSDAVYAVATLDVTSVKNTRVSLQKLKQLGYDNSRVRLILNRADSKVLLDASEVEKTLQGRFAARIPSDRLVPRSVNRGEPIVFDSPKSGTARCLMALAESIANERTGVGGDVA